MATKKEAKQARRSKRRSHIVKGDRVRVISGNHRDLEGTAYGSVGPAERGSRHGESSSGGRPGLEKPLTRYPRGRSEVAGAARLLPAATQPFPSAACPVQWWRPAYIQLMSPQVNPEVW